tara:strand:+ start:4089 stop:4976 length:888 start_codon:yes stop_codon:yes gene_type:complete
MRTGIDNKNRVIKLDNYSLSLFRECPRKYFNRIESGLTPETSSKSLAPELLFGIAIHRAMDTLFNEQDLDLACERFLDAYQPVPEDTKRTPGRGVSIIEDYWERWSRENDRYELSVSEVKFEVNIGQVPSIDGEPSYDVFYGGLIDKVLMRNDQVLLMDHKTSSWESTYLIPAYAQSQQFKGYVWAARKLNAAFASCTQLIVDVLLIKPKNNDFFRSEIICNEDDLEEWREGILQTIQMMLMCKHTNTWPQFGKESCTNWNRLCPYFELCDAKKFLRRGMQESLYTTDFWDTSNR